MVQLELLTPFTAAELEPHQRQEKRKQLVFLGE